MTDIGKIEYRVRPVTRYHVTRYHETVGGRTGGSEQKGEFDSPDVAYSVAYALCKDEHDRLGWRAGDERIKYPEQPESRGVASGVDLLATRSSFAHGIRLR